jgi:hypothetical protein
LGCVLELEEDVWRGEEHIVLRPVMMAPGWKFTGLPGMVGAAVA